MNQKIKIKNKDILLLFRQFAVIECRHRHGAFPAEKSWFFTVFPGFSPLPPPVHSLHSFSVFHSANRRFMAWLRQINCFVSMCIHVFFSIRVSFCSRFVPGFPRRICSRIERDVCFCIFCIIARL